MTTMLEPPKSPRTAPPGSRPATRGARARRPLPARMHSWRDPAVWAAALSTITIGLWALTGGSADLRAGGVDTVLGLSRLAGIVAALGALFGLVLTARPAWLERSAGLDRMIGWHRVAGMSAAFGMGVHVTASVVAAGGGPGRAWTGLVDLLGTDWYVAAAVAALLFAVVSLTSWRRIRAHLSYETWHMVHLAGYLAVALAFPHALFTGSTIAASTFARWWWIGLYVAVAGIILASRAGGILRSASRPRTTIARVVPEALGVASLVITGRGVDRLTARPGQFVCLRILTPDLWWQAHPYSLSAAPQPGVLRLTVKALGDASTRTLSVRPGTRVLLEGPYGTMTIDRAGGRRVLLVGAGVGLAPMRALLEDCPSAAAPLVLARAHSAADLPLAAELASLATARGGAMVPVLGPRSGFRGGNPFTAQALLANVPDVRTRAVFVCGPQALADLVCRELERAGVHRAQIHCERFAW
ncbi:MAG: ferric reductase-like transmembrane domain-containing protein [Candidatus Nanopelagicales bacterium]